MSERVSNELAQAIANGRGFATPSDWPLVDVEVMVALDLLDSRARVKELEEAYRDILSLLPGDRCRLLHHNPDELLREEER
jgi:hypothetical protein